MVDVISSDGTSVSQALGDEIYREMTRVRIKARQEPDMLVFYSEDIDSEVKSIHGVRVKTQADWPAGIVGIFCKGRMLSSVENVKIVAADGTIRRADSW